MYLLDHSHGDHILPAAAPSTDGGGGLNRFAPMSRPFSPLKLSGSFTQADTRSAAYSNSLSALPRQRQQQHQPLSKSAQEMRFITFWRRAVDRVAWRSPRTAAEGCLFLGSLDFACGAALLDAPRLHNRPLKVDGSLECSRYGCATVCVTESLRVGRCPLFLRVFLFLVKCLVSIRLSEIKSGY